MLRRRPGADCRRSVSLSTTADFMLIAFFFLSFEVDKLEMLPRNENLAGAAVKDETDDEDDCTTGFICEFPSAIFDDVD